MNDLKLEKNSKYFGINIFSVLIVLSLFLHQYQSGIPGASLADLLLGLSSVVLLIKYRFKIFVSLAVLSFISIFLTLLSFLIQGFLGIAVLTRLIRFNYYIFVLFICFNFFDLIYAMKIYRIIAMLVSAYIILQFITYNKIGIILPIKILPMALFREIDLNYMREIASIYYFRPSGIFVEPGYAAHFLLPALAFSLNGWGVKINKLKGIDIALVYTAMILTTSAQAILLGSFTIVFYLVLKVFDSKNYGTIAKYIGLSLFFIILLVPLTRLDNIQMIIDRFSRGATAGGSAALRLYRGYAIYAELPLIYKIIGIGHGNIGNFVNKYNIFTEYDVFNMSTTALDYVNGVSSILLYYGFAGLSLVIFHVSKFIKSIKKTEFLTIIFTFILLNFIEGAIFNMVMVFYVSLLYGGFKNNYYIN